MPKRYSEEFRRKVLDLVAAGRPVAQVAADLGISDQTIYVWRKQELIDTGQLQSELGAAKKRIRDFANEVAILKRARAAGVPATGGGRVGLLRVAVAAALAASDPPHLAH